MTAPTPLEMLRSALPGTEISAGRRYSLLRSKLPQPWKFWEYDGAKWAVFSVSSDRLSLVDQEGAEAATKEGVRPVFVADCYDGLRGVAQCYRKVQPYVICQCGGRTTLLNAPVFPKKRRLGSVPSETRISFALIDRLVAQGALSADLRRALVILKARYEEFLVKDGNKEIEEEKALLEFASSILDSMGLDKKKLRSARMVRTIERGDLGAHRDHFFHSFQNYFYGLEVVAQNPIAFEGYWRMFAAGARPDPFEVWFLTALWHDTGYTLQKSGEYYKQTLGTEFTEDDAKLHRRRFLKQDTVQRGSRVLSALSVHLLFPRSGREWVASEPIPRLQGRASQMRQAYTSNVDVSHGALGGLQLFSDFEGDLNRLDSGKGDVLRLAIQVAGCSMPFHDYWFRENVRNECGVCSFNPDTLPFAVLLAFVDSIQDDRRDLLAASPGTPSLTRLHMSKDAVVTAQMALDAVPDDELLLKIVEARDVLSILDQSGSQLKFCYPEWMTF